MAEIDSCAPNARLAVGARQVVGRGAEQRGLRLGESATAQEQETHAVQAMYPEAAALALPAALAASRPG